VPTELLSSRSRIALWFWICAIAAAGVATALAYATLDAGFLHGTGGRWAQPDNDSAAYVVAWNYYLNDAWRFPVFDVPGMGYPEGGSVLFIDALPLTAVLTKIVYSVTGARINPFGPWNLLTYILQGVFAARLMFALGVRSLPASLAASVLTVTCTGFMRRFAHTAVSSHFLLLWALALYFENRRGEKRLAELWVLAAVALLVNSYLFAMVMAFVAVTLLSLAIDRRIERRDLRTVIVGGVSVVAVALAAGYGIIFTSPASMQAPGFGLYSWNLAGLLVPRWMDVVRDATGGQYEGESYVGIGAVLVFAVAIAARPAAAIRQLRAHWMLVSLLLCFAIFAASNRVYAGGSLIVSYYLPPQIEALAAFFRATGRFIWPVAYALVGVSVAATFRWLRPSVAIVVAAAAVWLQLQEAQPLQTYFRTITGRADAESIDLDRFGRLIAAHDRVWQYPSYSCGGLAGPRRRWGDLDTNRELQLQVLAARAGVPMNSIYMSRMLKHCDREFEWAEAPRFEDGVLYVLSWKTASETPAIAHAIADGPCTGLSWAIVCSNAFKATPFARRSGERRP
jgi:hypothetical protein